MNTPRTDAAWAKTFEDDDDQCRAGNAATDMRDACATLERELAALATERDQLRDEVERLKKQAVFDADHVHTLNSAFATRAEVTDANARAERAEAAETVALANWNGALERALKAEADLAALEQCHDDNCRALVKIDAELQRACEVEQELRAEVKRMTHAYEYDHKCLYEVQDRCHLWKQRAEKAEAQLHALRLVCGTTDANKFETWTDRANARAEKAEGQLKELVAYASALEDQLDSVGVQIARTAMKEDAK